MTMVEKEISGKRQHKPGGIIVSFHAVLEDSIAVRDGFFYNDAAQTMVLRIFFRCGKIRIRQDPAGFHFV